MPRYIATRRTDTDTATADLTWGDNVESVTVRLQPDGGLDTSGIIDWSTITRDDGADFAEWLAGSDDSYAWTRFDDVSELTATIDVKLIEITDCDDGFPSYIQGKCDDVDALVEWLESWGVEVPNEPIDCGDGEIKIYVRL